MADLTEESTNPENRAGFFNPDTGEFSFSNSHKAIMGARYQEYIDGFNREIEELMAERQQLLAQWDQIEKEEMGEQRRPRQQIDPNNPDETVIKGKSGEEMVEDARQVVAPKLQQLKERTDEIDEEIASKQLTISHLQVNPSVTALQSGQVVLSLYGEMWHFIVAHPSKLKTEHSLKFIRDMQQIHGKIAINTNRKEYVLDQSNVAYVSDFIDDILKKVTSSLSGVGSLWLRRG